MQSKLIFNADWADLDVFGHINNVVILKYIQSARVHFWESAGIPVLPNPSVPGPVLASVSCTFKHRLYYPENITVISECTFVKNSSFGLRHLIQNKAEKLCAVGDDVIVLFDYQNNIKSPISDELREILGSK